MAEQLPSTDAEVRPHFRPRRPDLERFVYALSAGLVAGVGAGVLLVRVALG